jgi:hypothetical protein
LVSVVPISGWRSELRSVVVVVTFDGTSGDLGASTTVVQAKNDRRVMAINTNNIGDFMVLVW